jgi:5-amino-6-(5-phospho-D-ribitylamino)uracil phosphatase
MELIVFDLDGTLLNDVSQISTFTQETLTLLTRNNIAYTVATGRTMHSAQTIIDGYGFHLPHIYSNGVITWDPRNETLSLENMLTINEVKHIIDASYTQSLTPFVSTIDHENRHFIYHAPIANAFDARLMCEFQSRPNTQVLALSEMPKHTQITNISMLGPMDSVDEVQLAINNEAHLIAYSGPAIERNGLKWIDIHHRQANKGSAITLLREQLGISRVICFGDSDNDLSMFAIADESYAPNNARDEIKAAASGVIGHHDKDGVAHYLRERFNL